VEEENIFIAIHCSKQCKVKHPIKVSLGYSGPEKQTEENLKWRKCNVYAVDLGSLKSECQMRRNLNWET
jgi:hypothetical protein